MTLPRSRTDALHTKPRSFKTKVGSTLVNMDLDRFCLPQGLSETGLSDLIETHESRMVSSYWSKLSRPAPGNSLPSAFDIRRVNANRAPQFKRLKLRAVVQGMKSAGFDDSATATPIAIRDALSEVDGPVVSNLLESIRPSSANCARNQLKANALSAELPFFPSRVFEDLSNSGICTTPDSFIEWLCHAWQSRFVAADTGDTRVEILVGCK